METRCQKCGTPAASEQAFCSRCGAVLGMVDDAGGPPPELEATMVGRKLPTATPAPRPVTRPPVGPPTPAATPTTVPAPNARGERVLILVAVGILLALLVGTALVIFFLLGRR